MAKKNKYYLWRCYACGEAVHYWFPCDLITPTKKKPINCPYAADECEWIFKRTVKGSTDGKEEE